MNVSTHLQAPTPFLSVHCAFSPHGDGSQGELYSILVSAKIIKNIKSYYIINDFKDHIFYIILLKLYLNI